MSSSRSLPVLRYLSIRHQKGHGQTLYSSSSPLWARALRNYSVLFYTHFLSFMSTLDGKSPKSGISMSLSPIFIVTFTSFFVISLKCKQLHSISKVTHFYWFFTLKMMKPLKVFSGKLTQKIPTEKGREKVINKLVLINK